jgi:hypothetical protein
MTHSERLAWQQAHDEDRRAMQSLGGALLLTIATTITLILTLI